MGAHNEAENSFLVRAERELLQNLCDTGLRAISPDDLQALAHRSWAAPDHQIIFDVLFRLANISPPALRHQLPAEAACMGFPDVAWDKFLEVSANECESHRTTAELIAALNVGGR
jgi:hypothetical protein